MLQCYSSQHVFVLATTVYYTRQLPFPLKRFIGTLLQNIVNMPAEYHDTDLVVHSDLSFLLHSHIFDLALGDITMVVFVLRREKPNLKHVCLHRI